MSRRHKSWLKELAKVLNNSDNGYHKFYEALIAEGYEPVEAMLILEELLDCIHVVGSEDYE